MKKILEIDKDYVQVVENYLSTKGVFPEIDGLDTIDLMCAAPLLRTYPVNTGGALATYQKLLDKPIAYWSYGPAEDKKIAVERSERVLTERVNNDPFL